MTGIDHDRQPECGLRQGDPERVVEDLVRREVERDRGGQAEHDQHDQEPDAEQVVANSLAAMTRQPAGELAELGSLGRLGRSASDARGDGRAHAAVLPPDARRFTTDRLVGEAASLERGAIDVVERRHDRAEGGQAQAVLDRGDQDGLADAALLDRPAGRGAAMRRPRGRRASTDSTSASRAAPSRRALDVGRRRQLEPDLDRAPSPSPNWAASSRDGPLPDEPAGGEDPDPVADRLDLGQQVAREQDRRGRARRRACGAGRGSRRRRAGRSPSSARRG